MTNSMHRQGSIASLERDWVIFSHSSNGYNKKGSGPLHKRFAEICLKYKPSNMGIGEFKQEKTDLIKELLKDRYNSTRYKDGLPTEEQLSVWKNMIDGMGDESAYAVFSTIEQLEEVVKEVKNEDLGISININALHDQTDTMLKKCGITRHSVEHSLGFHGNTDKLPSKEVLEISSMCGHAMVSYNLSKKMVDSVRLGQVSPEKAGELLKKTCSCGIFNSVRATEIIKEHLGLK